VVGWLCARKIVYEESGIVGARKTVENALF
jgi:hypothetical protein